MLKQARPVTISAAHSQRGGEPAEAAKSDLGALAGGGGGHDLAPWGQQEVVDRLLEVGLHRRRQELLCEDFN